VYCQRFQACLWGSQDHCQCSQTCHWRFLACRRPFQILPSVPKLLSGALWCSETYHDHSHGTPVPVLRGSSFSQGRQEYSSRVWYSPEIDPSKFTLHILSDPHGVIQRLKFILSMSQACHHRSQSCRRLSQRLPDWATVLSGTLRCSQTCHNHSHGALASSNQRSQLFASLAAMPF